MPLDPNTVPPDGGKHQTPKWREHFPIDSAKEAARSRRDFIGGLTITGGAVAVGQVAINYAAPQHGAASNQVETSAKDHAQENSATDNSRNAPLRLKKKQHEIEIGEAYLFHYPNERTPCLLIRLRTRELVAFQQKCTHLACPVIPNFETGHFECPCHHGVFDLSTGNVIAGPPRRPLVRLAVNVDEGDGTITVSLP